MLEDPSGVCHPSVRINNLLKADFSNIGLISCFIHDVWINMTGFKSIGGTPQIEKSANNAYFCNSTVPNKTRY